MPRVVNEVEYAARRNDILNVAQRYVYTKGYAQMSIQDILDDLQISKGAFYHYFDSKGALLEAMIERNMEEAMQILTPVVEDDQIRAIEKLNQLFITAGRWKATQRDYYLGLLSIWYADDNVLIRNKTQVKAVKCMTPMMIKIVHQGIQEGVFHTSYPDEMGELILTMQQSLGESLTDLLLHPEDGLGVLNCASRLLDAYTRALERVLGAPDGSISLMDQSLLETWFIRSDSGV